MQQSLAENTRTQTRAWPLDAAVAAAWGVAAFVLSYVNYWLPGDKIFDEVYFARAAEEYLTHKYIYENTHPPLTKLIITLSTMLFGGMPHGDNAAGWRFMDVLFGAIAVALLYVFAKRLTQSTLFASFAALLFTADGMHYVQSRIATPEGIVIVFSLGALYAFYRFELAVAGTTNAAAPWKPGAAAFACAGAAILLGLGSSLLANWLGNPPGTTPMPDWIGGVSIAVAAAYFGFGWYLLLRLVVAPRLDRRVQPVRLGAGPTRWLLAFSLLLGALVASKWYGVMAYGVSFGILAYDRIRRRSSLPLDVVIGTIVFASMSVYVCAWIPDLVRHVVQGDTGVANLHELVYRQYTMFEYHDHLRATHPYQSVWWQWPLDLRPILYYANYTQTTAALIYTLPNPVILWFGLFTVPAVGVLAWREKNRGYALLVVAYVLQWLPWSLSPRITFDYHFYVNIPIVILCNVIVLQRVWQTKGTAGRACAAAYVALCVAWFAWFFPMLNATPISFAARDHRLLIWLLGRAWM